MSAALSSASKSATSAGTQISKSASSVGTELSKSAASAKSAVNEYLFDTWSDSQLKEFLDENHVPIPQGSKKNEMIALARKYRASATGNAASTVSGSAASAYGAATSNIGSQYAQATDGAASAANAAFGMAVDSWSESRLKAYLDARGVPVPQSGKRDELAAAVRLNAHKAATGWSAWTFDTWTAENLQKYLESQGKKFKKGAKVNRDELMKQAQEQYASASKTGGTQYASITNYLAKQTDAAKADAFDTWSDSDLKDFLDSYGVKNYQGSTTNELRAEAKKQYNYFKYGTSSTTGTFFAQLQNGFQWILNQIRPVASSASVTASNSASSAASSLSKSASSAASSASKAAASSASSLKKEL